jgi:hypothetical protein
MITLQQDSDGFIRMNKHFPAKTLIAVVFTDGSSETVTGQVLNAKYDKAQAEFRAGNRLDIKGFSRSPVKTVQPKGSIDFVPVAPGLAG